MIVGSGNWDNLGAESNPSCVGSSGIKGLLRGGKVLAGNERGPLAVAQHSWHFCTFGKNEVAISDRVGDVLHCLVRKYYFCW